MKSRIALSPYTSIITCIYIIVLLTLCVVIGQHKVATHIFLAVFLILILSAFLFGAFYIKADSKYVILGSILRKRKILISNIESVELFQPSKATIRICGSGGFMGYWGIFKEADLGRYYAFYGKASDCFLVRMKNGDKYVLGCENPSAMFDYIKSLIS